MMQKLIADQHAGGPVKSFPLIVLCEIPAAEKLGRRSSTWSHTSTSRTSTTGPWCCAATRRSPGQQQPRRRRAGSLQGLPPEQETQRQPPPHDHSAHQLYKNTGKEAMAKRDLSRIYAEDPDYPGLEDEIRALNQPDTPGSPT